MAWSRENQRAILAIRDVIAQGGRVLRSSRAFWSRYGFPPIDQRTDMIRAARDLLSISNEIEAGSITGDLAQALTDAGFPTSDISGGLSGGPEATAFFRAQFGSEESGYTWRSIRVALPWYTSIDQLQSALQEAVDEMGANYGLDNGSITPGTVAIY